MISLHDLTETLLHSSLIPDSRWHPFPDIDDRESWNALMRLPLNKARRDFILEKAQDYADTPLSVIRAVDFMRFRRDGDRDAYENPYFDRRRRLAFLVLAECIENNGTFIDPLINCIWAICEESGWNGNAHNSANFEKNWPSLPLIDNPVVDLFAAETAASLAEAVYLIGRRLDKASLVICRRVSAEIEHRIFAPLENRIPHWWYEGINNWTPWCCADALGAAMYQMRDSGRLARFTALLCGYVARFTDKYSDEGGCDEGPMYWGVAAGALFKFLELVYERSDGALDLFRVPKIREMGAYLPRVHLSGPWFAAFADSPSKVKVRRALTWRFGERTKNTSLMALAWNSSRKWNSSGQVDPVFSDEGSGAQLWSMLREFFWMPSTWDNRPDITWEECWLSDIQVAVMREVRPDGFIVAAKGGHNGENHNHNDIGQFVVLLGAEPVITELGKPLYTAQTFSDKRYDLLCTRSGGHNVPLINGFEQAAGVSYCARNVAFSQTADQSSLEMDIAPAYPEQAALCTLLRKIVLDKKSSAVLVHDRIVSNRSGITVEMRLHVPKPCHIDEGSASVSVDSAIPCRIACEAPPESIQIERCEDVAVLKNWPEGIWCVKVVWESAGCEIETGISLKAILITGTNF